MGNGTLTVTVHTAEDSLPISNARVIIKNTRGEILYNVICDANGNTDEFTLQAPDKALTLDKYYTKPAYGLCDVDVEMEGYITVHIHDVQIVDTEKSILNVEMHPEYEYGEDEDIFIPPISAIMPTDQRQVGANPFLLKDVIIPEYITVHLGTPTNANARNVKIKFIDYVKNSASSEIYPTWPTNSLIANIHVIVTFALNRVYTEWYRSRGFNFDITNSTAYDQYFVEGRDIFNSISVLVDDLFNVYARRFAFRNPFFTSYCNGTTSTCEGLSQWGTVDLANQGYTPIQILHYYYPNDLELIRSYNVQGITQSYPGVPLRLGDNNENVRLMQNYLNRIRVNFPLIEQISNPNGYFGVDTQTAVRTFQRSFNLAADGIIGNATWNKIAFTFVGVTRLAELDAEGQRMTIGNTPPTSTLSLNSRGVDVLELQFILNTIAQYYDSVPPVIQDSVFGATTRNSVIEFQKTFNLVADGIVGRSTWNMLYAVYRGIYDNVAIPPVVPADPNQVAPYPGYPLSVGSTGSNVSLMQSYLNTIRTVYTSIPQVTVDGVFGNETQNAVIAFQRKFLLDVDGIIGQATWNEIVKQFLLVTGGASVSTTYPGTPLRIGSRGNSVRLMQTFLNEIRTFNPAIPPLSIDGVFGNETYNAVVAFQNYYGLTPDGIIGPATWAAIVNERNRLF